MGYGIILMDFLCGSENLIKSANNYYENSFYLMNCLKGFWELLNRG